MKVAYFCEPQVGGTFSFFRRLRPHLAAHGIEFRCISPYSGERRARSRFAAEEGVDDVIFPEDNLPEASRILIRHLRENHYAAVMVLPGSDILAVNLVRYLPRTIRTAARVPMIARGAYAPARAVAPALNRIFAVSHRVAGDLSSRYHLPPEKIRIIYNGVDIPAHCGPRTYGLENQPFRLFYSGRLSDMEKGILLFPRILECVRSAGVDARLELAGDGPDAERLRWEFQRRGLLSYVTMAGNLSAAEIEERLAEADCFVLPSRFEGCPNALLEAMAAGCACVAARIRGSVDRIVEDERSGLLATVAAPEDFARQIVRLAQQPALCRQLGENARRRVAEQYRIEQTASAYAETLHEMMGQPDDRMPALSLENYRIPRAMLPTWRTRIPPSVKNFLRKWLERLGIST